MAVKPFSDMKLLIDCWFQTRITLIKQFNGENNRKKMLDGRYERGGYLVFEKKLPKYLCTQKDHYEEEDGEGR